MRRLGATKLVACSPARPSRDREWKTTDSMQQLAEAGQGNIAIYVERAHQAEVLP